MSEDPRDAKKAADLLAEWRAAGRDVVAARNAARVAELALLAATEAENAATQVEEAATLALDAVEKARSAASRARRAASEATIAANLILSEAQGDKARANYQVGLAEQAEKDAGDAFHRAEDKGFPTD